MGKTETEAEVSILLPSDTKANLEKTLMLGKIESKRRRGETEAEMVRQHHQLNGYEFEQTLGDGEGQTGKPGVLQSMGFKDLDTT